MGKKYYISTGTRLKFSPTNTCTKVLVCHDETKIVRHVKLKATASVYDGNDLYWSYRLAKFNGLKKKPDYFKGNKDSVTCAEKD